MSVREKYEARRRIRREALINRVQSDCYFFNILRDGTDFKTTIGQYGQTIFEAYQILHIPEGYSMTFSHIEHRL